MPFKDRLVHAFNAFLNLDRQTAGTMDVGPSYSVRPDRTRLLTTNERSIITSVYTRIAMDAAAVPVRHVRLDDDDRYIGEVNSGLNNCLKVEANLDQAARAFRQDYVMSLFNEGAIAIVPVDTSVNPASGSFDILTMRVGNIVQWYPQHVRVSVYNEQRGVREELILEKRSVAIIENPLYDVMNLPNSTAQRLIRKLGLLDSIDEQSGSGKMDLIIQLPYVVKSESMKQRAEQRRRDIEFQLKDSKYGIAYTDGTEKITQLNRPVENNLLKQIEYLTTMLYGQLGITPEVMNGTADEATMINYQNRTIEPILTAFVEGLRRSFLTKTARTQKQSVEYFRDPFKLVPVSQLAEIADKFTRNEITSSNEIRQFIGLKPSKDPKADQLRNSNMPQSELGIEPAAPAATDPSAPLQVESARADLEPEPDFEAMDSAMNDVFDGMTAEIDKLMEGLG